MKDFKFNEGRHMYTLDGKPLMGVTTVLGVIAKPNLISWAARMACESIRQTGEKVGNPVGSSLNITEIDLIIAEKAHAQNRDKAADDGTELHKRVEDYIDLCIRNYNGKPAPADEIWRDIKPFIEWAIHENIRFIGSEVRMYNEELWLAGTADFIFEKDGETYIGDIKTYKKIWDRVPFLQMAAYGLMYASTFGKKPKGLVVVRLRDNEIEPLWSFNVEEDTEAFLAALTLYKHLKNFTY